MDTVSKEEVKAVYPQVAQAIADALGREAAEMSLESRLIEDFNAESIDFLDIVFRLEQGFKVKIPRGQIVDSARGDLSEEEFAQKGLLTEAGMARLKAYMDEVPPERLQAPLHLNEIPALFTVETFCKLVARALQMKRRQ